MANYCPLLENGLFSWCCLLRATVLQLPGVGGWNCRTASALYGRAARVLWWGVCSPQELECCNLPQCQFGTWGLELSGLLRGIRGCLRNSVCCLTKGPRHRCFHHCWQVHRLHNGPLLAVYRLTVVDALGISTWLHFRQIAQVNP